MASAASVVALTVVPVFMTAFAVCVVVVVAAAAAASVVAAVAACTISLARDAGAFAYVDVQSAVVAVVVVVGAVAAVAAVVAVAVVCCCAAAFAEALITGLPTCADALAFVEEQSTFGAAFSTAAFRDRIVAEDAGRGTVFLLLDLYCRLDFVVAPAVRIGSSAKFAAGAVCVQALADVAEAVVALIAAIDVVAAHSAATVVVVGAGATLLLLVRRR